MPPSPTEMPHVPVQAERPVAAVSECARALIVSRQTHLPKHLAAPGPDESQLRQLFEAAAAAPDHGLLRPWRFILVPETRRADLAEVFARALQDRDPNATPEQFEMAREKAYRAPCLMLVVARLAKAEPNIRAIERMVSVGAAVQNILLTAHAMGFGSSLTSGQAMTSPHMHALFALERGEKAVCFVNIGTVTRRKTPRVHPEVSSFVSSL
ncbi:MAG: nitroreductase [Casimicrobiaceae bacterium]